MKKNKQVPMWKRISLKFRKKRMADFEAFFLDKILKGGGTSPTETITILDLGGTLDFWKSMDFKYLNSAKITLLNLGKMEIPAGYDHITSVIGDATDLSRYADRQFDLVFSNSVIEHVGDFEAQKRMAAEMIRTGKHYYLQTPNKWFLVEPHFMFPYFQLLPLKVKAFLVRRFKLGVMRKGQNRVEAMEIADSVRLLSLKELKRLFPGSIICKEKFLFMTKSFYLFSK